jgi:low temperature requirement protein LtrA
MLVAMAAMFVAALAVPDAFGHHALVFGAAFLIVNLMHIALFALAGRRDADLLAAVLRIAPSTLAGAATSFWLAYFDFFPMRGRQMLEERRGEARTALARDAYTYLHLPMVVGIVLFALAMKETLAHVGEELDTIPALGLCGGSALYLFAYVALRLRLSRTVGRGRFAAAVVFVLLLPVALAVPALVALALTAAVWIALHAYEIIWWREARAQTRALRVPASAS